MNLDRNKIRSWGWLCGLILWMGCVETDRAPDGDAQQRFFDLSDYFEAEMETLRTRNEQLQKTVRLNETEESKTINDVEWGREFAPFVSSDINRVALLDRYTADTTRTADDQLKIVYAARDSSLRTRRIGIWMEADAPTMIRIENRTKNWITQSRQLLTYQPGAAYRIETTQRVILSDPRTISIDGRW